MNPTPSAVTPSPTRTSGAGERPAPPPPRPVTLSSAGGWPFLVTAFLARMPASMVQLGYLMVLTQAGRGMATAGLAVGAVGLGSALGAPLVGRMVDRLGPLPVISAATLVSLGGQLGFLLLLLRDAPSAALLACAGVVGAANPQIGPVARSHWSHLAVSLRAPHLVPKALGYEGAVDEIGFVVGPVVAGLMVSLLGPTVATGVIMGATALLQGAFVVHLARAREQWRHASPATGSAQPRGSFSTATVWPMVACLGVGTLFGATQTGLTALNELRGTPAVTGMVYGCVGVGSGVVSVLVSRIPQRVTLPMRLLVGAAAIAGGAVLMMMLPPAWQSAGVALLLGAGAGITLVTSFTWMERIAPRHRVATMMTVLATCLTLGVSGGATLAGRLAHEPAHAFWPVLGSAALAVVASLGMALGRRSEHVG